MAILGGGAFGTALAVALAAGGADVTLWARDRSLVEGMRRDRQNGRLPGVTLPAKISVTSTLADVAGTFPVLLAVPMQALGAFLKDASDLLNGRPLVACCKGVDLTSLKGPTGLIADACPDAMPAILTGPSFAADIARGLPTALTLACRNHVAGEDLQRQLSTPTLRIYRTPDVIGAELGGALKNVIAIAAGIVVGAGLGDSARAALMTRGYAEILRMALHLGAQSETLAGLSGLGDLVLTCTSAQSRNFRYGRSLSEGGSFDRSLTVEGVATAHAVSALAAKEGIEMPITQMVWAVLDGKINIRDAIDALLSRPLKQE
ncbi:MAG: NAD(P)-dependent glycerol-3-phosphate dehydrogenase [Paracoccaceae bacterium]|nr:NAD(P)-dependent glycerol-3-phosphate dehydrogenase [Paracoccaceae bacterium]